jgi:hypothetical protein
MSKETPSAEERVQCPRDALRRCNHVQPDWCCGGGYNASCDCVCHRKPIDTAPRDGVGGHRKSPRDPRRHGSDALEINNMTADRRLEGGELGEQLHFDAANALVR